MPSWRRRKPHVALGYRVWPRQDRDDPLTTAKVVELYRQGFAGTKYDPEAEERLFGSQQWPDGEQAAYDFGLVGTGEGKLSLPFLAAYAHWPKCWPCPGQEGPDCVGHATKNAGLVLLGVEAETGQPDEVTGAVEGFPEISAEAEAQGVVACEANYGYRGHSGGGANCSQVIGYVTTAGGVLIRQNYPDAGVDLTRYNYRLSANWGGKGPPAALNTIAKQHQVRAATDCPTHEVVRDFHANGYPMQACSGLGWSSSRDENGYSRQQGGWSHSWVTMGYDDRPKIKAKYGFPLALYNHDWAKWNGGGRDIFESADLVPAQLRADWIARGIVNAATGNIMIPDGSMWIDARLLNRCDCTALSNLNGWPRRAINNLLV